MSRVPAPHHAPPPPKPRSAPPMPRRTPKRPRTWRMSRRNLLIKPHGGKLVPEFNQSGKPPETPPQRPPEARRLLAALPDPTRASNAVVDGEPQRAFYGNQF